MNIPKYDNIDYWEEIKNISKKVCVYKNKSYLYIIIINK